MGLIIDPAIMIIEICLVCNDSGLNRKMLPKVEQSSAVFGSTFVAEHTARIPSASLSY